MNSAAPNGSESGAGVSPGGSPGSDRPTGRNRLGGLPDVRGADAAIPKRIGVWRSRPKAQGAGTRRLAWFPEAGCPG